MSHRKRNLVRRFTFDRVYTASSTQFTIYNEVVAPIVEEVLQGYNCTVFAYGQTGTGKTYTMEGDARSETRKGIIPRAVQHIFTSLQELGVDFTVHVTNLEIYNEEIHDLLATGPEAKPVRLYDETSSKRGIVIANATTAHVADVGDVLGVLERSMARRVTAATNLNDASSRSHCVFIVQIRTKEVTADGAEVIKVGKLYLVDLAGSENMTRAGTDASDVRKKEAASINQSLSTLGRVIDQLCQEASYVPYRDSKLTRLLQESLGGRSKTCIIATISPAVTSLDETLSTLDYAYRARNIRNTPEANQTVTKRRLLQEQEQELASLRRQLRAQREKDGVYVDAAQYGLLEAELERRRGRVDELEARIAQTEEELREVEMLMRESERRAARAEDEAARAQSRLEETAGRLEETAQWLAAAKGAVARQERELARQRQTEGELRASALALVRHYRTAIAHVEALHAKLERVAAADAAHRRSADLYRRSIADRAARVARSVADYTARNSADVDALKGVITSFAADRAKELSDAENTARELADGISKTVSLVFGDANRDTSGTLTNGGSTLGSSTDESIKNGDNTNGFDNNGEGNNTGSTTISTAATTEATPTQPADLQERKKEALAFEEMRTRASKDAAAVDAELQTAVGRVRALAATLHDAAARLGAEAAAALDGWEARVDALRAQGDACAGETARLCAALAADADVAAQEHARSCAAAVAGLDDVAAAQSRALEEARRALRTQIDAQLAALADTQARVLADAQAALRAQLADCAAQTVDRVRTIAHSTAEAVTAQTRALANEGIAPWCARAGAVAALGAHVDAHCAGAGDAAQQQVMPMLEDALHTAQQQLGTLTAGLDCGVRACTAASEARAQALRTGVDAHCSADSAALNGLADTLAKARGACEGDKSASLADAVGALGKEAGNAVNALDRTVQEARREADTALAFTPAAATGATPQRRRFPQDACRVFLAPVASAAGDDTKGTSPLTASPALSLSSPPSPSLSPSLSSPSLSQSSLPGAAVSLVEEGDCAVPNATAVPTAPKEDVSAATSAGTATAMEDDPMGQEGDSSGSGSRASEEGTGQRAPSRSNSSTGDRPSSSTTGRGSGHRTGVGTGASTSTGRSATGTAAGTAPGALQRGTRHAHHSTAKAPTAERRAVSAVRNRPAATTRTQTSTATAGTAGAPATKRVRHTAHGGSATTTTASGSTLRGRSTATGSTAGRKS